MQELSKEDGEQKFINFCKQNSDFVKFLKLYVTDKNDIITSNTIRSMMKYFRADNGKSTQEIGQYAATRALKLKHTNAGYSTPELNSFNYVCEVYEKIKNNISYKSIYKELKLAFCLLSFTDTVWFTRFLTKQINKEDIFYKVIKDARL